MTAIPIVLSDASITSVRDLAAVLRKADDILSKSGRPERDYPDRIARAMERRRLTWTAPDGSGSVATWVEDHAFGTRTVALGTWFEIRDGAAEWRVVEMERGDGSNVIPDGASAESVRCALAQMALSVEAAERLPSDAWTRPAFETDVILTHHLDAETEAGASTMVGMATALLGHRSDVAVMMETGRPYGRSMIYGLVADRETVAEVAGGLDRLIPSQIGVRRLELDGIETWQLGPRAIPTRLHDVRLSAADVMRIAAKIGMHAPTIP